MKKTVKKEINKVAKKIKEEVVEVAKQAGATFNEYGTCIECQGGDPSCHHNNLVDTNGKITCVTCGKCVSE